jgi:hypothetical protein
LQQCIDPLLFTCILFTDEATCTCSDRFSYQIEHVWAVENPNKIISGQRQERFSINVCADIIGDQLTGNYVLPTGLTNRRYRSSLQIILPTAPEDLPLTARRNMWFLHDGHPAHTGRIA